MPLVRREKLHPEAVRVLDSLKIRNSYPPFDNQKAADFLDANRDSLDREAGEMVDRIKLQQYAGS